MGPTDPFRLFFPVSASQPVLRRCRLEAMRTREIARALEAHEGEVRVPVPHCAMPGGTSITEVEAAASALLRGRISEARAREVAAELATGTWTHDHPISAEEAKAPGLPVSTEMPSEVLERMTLYPQPVRRQGGGVEYLPVPRQRESRAARGP